MTDLTTQPETQKCCNRGKCCGWKKKLALLLGVAAIAALGFYAGRHSPRPMMMGGGFMEHRTDKALDKLNATPEQRAKIKMMMAANSTDFMAMRLDMQKSKTEMLQILSEPTVSREKIEAVRQTHLVKMQETSQKISKAIGDVASELTLEQRQQLVSYLSKGSHMR